MQTRLTIAERFTTPRIVIGALVCGLCAVAPAQDAGDGWKAAEESGPAGCTYELRLPPEPLDVQTGRRAAAARVRARQFQVMGRAELRCRELGAVPQMADARFDTAADEARVFAALSPQQVVSAAARRDAEAHLAELLESIAISTTRDYRDLRRRLDKLTPARARAIAARLLEDERAEHEQTVERLNRDGGEALAYTVSISVGTDRLKAAVEAVRQAASARPPAPAPRNQRERDADDDDDDNDDDGPPVGLMVPLILVGAFFVLRASVRRGPDSKK